VASDIPAILAHTRKIFFLADGDIAVLTPEGVRVLDLMATPSSEPSSISPGTRSCRKGGYKHYMQKEIFEQPRAVSRHSLASVALDSAKVIPRQDGCLRGSIPKFHQCKDRGLRHKLARGLTGSS